MKQEVLLRSRYGDTYRLERIGEKDSHLFSFKGNTDYLRIGIDNSRKGHYIFIDPPGGPFMSVDSKIDDYTIEDIWQDNEGIVLRLKE